MRTPLEKEISADKIKGQISSAKVAAKTKKEARESLGRFLSERKLINRKYKKWGISPKDIGKILQKTSSGLNVEKILKELTGWHDVLGGVELIPMKNALVFLFRKDFAFMHISKAELAKATKFAFVYPSEPPVVLMRKNLLNSKQFYKGNYIYGNELVYHELEHVVQDRLPILNDPVRHKRKKGRLHQLRNIHSIQRLSSRDIVREIASNLRETNGMPYLRKVYGKIILERVAYENENFASKKNDTTLFARNEGNYLHRMYVDAEKVFDLVDYAQKTSTTNASGKRVKVFTTEELINLITNLRELRAIRQRLPEIIEIQRAKKKKSK